MAAQENAGNHVCIVGAGPAGVILSLLLIRKGIKVTLLEAQADFDRDFRGDSLHASSLEILDQLELAEPILKISHARVEKFRLTTRQDDITMADFSRLDTNFPYIALIPQEKFLGYLTELASQSPHFHLEMSAKFHDLVVDDGKIRGVRYIKDGVEKEITASLVVGADGRGSRVREKAGIKLGKTSPPMDVIWFKLPRPDNYGAQNRTGGQFGKGTMLAVLDRGDELQVGYVIVKGSYKDLREAGITALHSALVNLMPDLDPVAGVLKDWNQCAILSVVTGRVNKWYKPGLLLIGDAAHVMSPVGGVGINYAIQDAVAAANVLIKPLLQQQVSESDLAEVQKRRERPVKFIQTVQSLIQKRIITAALKSDKPFRPPLAVRILARFDFFRKGMARIMAYGINPETIEQTA